MIQIQLKPTKERKNGYVYYIFRIKPKDISPGTLDTKKFYEINIRELKPSQNEREGGLNG